MQVRLKVLSGAHEGKEISIKDTKFFIGRSESCQLRPKSESISRKHCAIVQKDGKLLALDLKSRNGTFVNDKQLSADKAKVLKDGDMLRVGKLEFQVVVEVGIGGAKKPEVKDVREAAERIAKTDSQDSRFEEIDISSWLDEAEQVDRRGDNPETRHFTVGDFQSGETLMSGVDDTTNDTEGTTPEKPSRPEKRGPIKLPKSAKLSSGSTKDAASETLRKYLGGRG